MSIKPFNDGFPNTPSEAIEFSYFLSNSEKQEWRDWLQNATLEQQDELVDILHTMWLDNQRNTVTNGFASSNFDQAANPQPEPAPQFNNPAPEPKPQPVQNPTQGFNPNFAKPQPINETLENDFATARPALQPVQNPNPAGQSNLAENKFNNNFAANQNPPAASSTQPSQFSENTNQRTKAPEPTQQFAQAKPSENPQNKVPLLDAPFREANNLDQDEEENFDLPPVVENNRDDHFAYQGDNEAEFDEENNETIKGLIKNNRYTPNPLLDNYKAMPDPEGFSYKNNTNANLSNQNSNSNITASAPASPRNTEADENTGGNNSSQGYTNSSRDNTRPRKNQPTQNSNSSPKSDSRVDSRPKNDTRARPTNESRPARNFDPAPKERVDNEDGILQNFYQDYKQVVEINQEKQAKFLDRLGKSIVSLESRILAINEQNLKNTEDLTVMHNALQSSSGRSLQEQIDEIDRKLEDVYYQFDKLRKEQRDLRNECRRRLDEISITINTFGGDAYRQDSKRWDMLRSQMSDMEQKINFLTQGSNPSPSSGMGPNSMLKKPKLPNSGDSIPTKTSTIDMRGVL